MKGATGRVKADAVGATPTLSIKKKEEDAFQRRDVLSMRPSCCPTETGGEHNTGGAGGGDSSLLLKGNY